MSHLALIDDDIEIRKLLGQYLTEQGFKVSSFADGESFLQTDMSQFDTCILDIGLPGIDGLEVCRQLRKQSYLPIIMLTAASDDLDRILGLELGADDYMGKPFNPRELLARIKALLRRIEVITHPLSEVSEHLVIDRPTRTVKYGEIDIELTGAEFDLLATLADNSGEVLSRDKIAHILHGRMIQPFDRSIDTTISRLRKKLSVVTGSDCIQSVRGKGYVLTIRL